MHKPLKTAPSGKWNAMHGKIAHFIQAGILFYSESLSCFWTQLLE